MQVRSPLSTTINSLLAPRVQPLQATQNKSAAAAQPSAIVSLNNANVLPAVYSLNPAKTINTAGLEYSQLSIQMSANVRGPQANAFQGLGKALLEGLKDHPNGVTLSAVAETEDAQARQPDRAVALTITTASGINVSLGMTRNQNGLAVELKTSGGELSEEETAAIAGLAGAFQSALDGLSADTPSLNVQGLMNFDSTLLKAVDLQTDVRKDTDSLQSLKFHADNSARAMSYKTDEVAFELSTDLSHPETVGSYGQQQQALASWASQLDSARTRGQGDKNLIDMFKNSFMALNSQYGSNETDNRLNIITRTTDNIVQENLSGLADYSANFKQADKSPNPLRKDERDSFAYSSSQRTERENAYNLSQKTTSHLQASYHQPLDKTLPLALTLEASSQNYSYHQIDDSSSTGTALAFNDKGEVKSVTNTAEKHNVETVKKYNAGRLIEESRTPYDDEQTSSRALIVDSLKVDHHSGR